MKQVEYENIGTKSVNMSNIMVYLAMFSTKIVKIDAHDEVDNTDDDGSSLQITSTTEFHLYWRELYKQLFADNK